MVEEIKVNIDLLYLENVLFSLDAFQFDKDIIKLLNELSSLVSKKLYSSCSFDKDVMGTEYKTVFHYKK